MFEAIHGSAPRLAGQDRANPSSLIGSAAMLLRHLGAAQAADAIDAALETALTRPETRTADLGGTLGTAAFGALGVILLAAAFRCLSWQALVRSVTGTLRVTLMAYLIVFGSATFSQLLAFSGASHGLISWATGFDLAPLAMLLVMFGVLLLLGMFMEQISMMLLTVPIFFPLAQSLGFDLVWFALIMLLALEISFTTPPFGLLLFVMKGVAPPGTTMREIYGAAFPYIGCSLLLVALLIVFPPLALWLPGL